MKLEIGQKYLLEVTFEQDDGREKQPLLLRDSAGVGHRVDRRAEIRPWTEKPVTVLWTDPEGYKVLSNGSVQSHSSDLLANDFKSSAVLAAYVRHLGAK